MEQRRRSQMQAQQMPRCLTCNPPIQVRQAGRRKGRPGDTKQLRGFGGNNCRLDEQRGVGVRSDDIVPRKFDRRIGRGGAGETNRTGYDDMEERSRSALFEVLPHSESNRFGARFNSPKCAAGQAREKRQRGESPAGRCWLPAFHIP